MPFPVPIPVPIPVLTASPPHAPPRAPARARRSSRGPQLGYHPTASTPQLPSVPVDCGSERTHMRREAQKLVPIRIPRFYFEVWRGVINTTVRRWESGRGKQARKVLEGHVEYTSTRPHASHAHAQYTQGASARCPAPVVMLHDHVAALASSAGTSPRACCRRLISASFLRFLGLPPTPFAK